MHFLRQVLLAGCETDKRPRIFQNERICAIAMFFFDVQNTTEIKLRFQKQVSAEEPMRTFPRVNDRRTEEIYGIEESTATIQELETVRVREGRVVTFPNTTRYRLSDFELADHSKPGHCPVLTLDLVDPQRRIISTANVPCQQRDWWAEALRRDQKSGVSVMPPEIYDKIIMYVEDFPTWWEEALKIKTELEKEHEEFVEKHYDAMKKLIYFF